MSFNPTLNMNMLKSNLTRLQAGDSGRSQFQCHRRGQRRAGEAGNRHRFDLDKESRSENGGRTMNPSPAELLDPIFNFLDGLIQNDGVYFYPVFVCLSLAVIGWVLSGGLRRKSQDGNSAPAVPGIIITMQPPTQSAPPPIIGIGVGQTWDDDNETVE